MCRYSTCTGILTEEAVGSLSTSPSQVSVCGCSWVSVGMYVVSCVRCEGIGPPSGGRERGMEGGWQK